MKTLEEYMKMPWRTTVHREDVGNKVFFVASHPELSSCLGHGPTPDDALADLKAAREDLLTVLIELGAPIPIPTWSFSGTRIVAPSSEPPTLVDGGTPYRLSKAVPIDQPEAVCA